MTNEEIWKAIPSAPGYEASSHGRVKSFKRFSKGQILSPGVSRGYLLVVLYLGEKRLKISRRLHSLVLETFVGPLPEGFHGCHLDGDKANNRLDNLEYKTPSENQKDAYRHGTRSYEKDRALSYKNAILRRTRYGPKAFTLSGLKATETKDQKYGRKWRPLGFAGIKYSKTCFDL